MKTYYRIVVILAIILCMGVAGVYALIGRDYGIAATGRETVLKLNDITKDAKEHFDDLYLLKDKDYGTDYVIINQSNVLLFDSRESGEGSEVTLESALINKLPYSYITKDGYVQGIVILLDDGLSEYETVRLRISLGLLAFVVLLVIGALLYGAYVKKRIIVPFKNMKDFAGRVAEGNLDDPLSMDKDNMFGAFTESFDIMREELLESRKRERALQKKEKELVASLSHDLKTPITGIKLTTELLKTKLTVKGDGEENKDTVEKLDNIYKKADQIDVLVNDLFSSTLDDLGEFKVNLNDEEAAVLLDIVKKYDDRGLTNISEIPGVLINIDVKRMSQVIGNIISNSYKYAGTKIDVTFDTVDEFLQMEIRDYGPGVPKDELNLITNKFYRGKDHANGKEDGSGLGLYIAKTLMEKMNGELIVSSEGEGFAADLLIPLS
ncbi:MAG: HAMP domain-containing histidine kinase [Lachnospiraceae bacterium]|nr:HAMP domain-containing histidine kinase [Lachnospiraceae bacterium]